MLIKLLSTVLILYFAWATWKYILKQVSPLLLTISIMLIISLILIWLEKILHFLQLNINPAVIYSPESFSLAVLIFGIASLLALKLLGSLRSQNRQLTDLTRQLAIKHAVVKKF